MKRIRSITIVGGGSAGWMTAAYLAAALRGVKLRLIESKHRPRIGVGEATVPLLNGFLGRLGLTTPDLWLPACLGSFKTGILYENWRVLGESFWHPFDTLDYVNGEQHTGHCWLRRHANPDGSYKAAWGFAETYFVSTLVNVVSHRAPHDATVAYHFDAALFAEMLRKQASAVEHVFDDVVDVVLDEQGNITALKTAEHGLLEADFFIDCTGFTRQVMSRVAPEQVFQSYARSLFNDRAVVTHLRYESEADRERELVPYVKAAALGAGWVWSIPLYDRLSLGYVYSSSFLTEDQAAAELEAYAGPRWHRKTGVRKIQFSTGKLPRTWVKNCAAIGLSGGFIEPLESTGLALAQLGIEILASMLDASFYDERMQVRYNEYLEKLYVDVQHFIICHYCFSKRDDTPYWRAVRSDTLIPEELQARLDAFKRHLPSHATKGVAEPWMFCDVNWFSVLLGVGFPFDIPEPDKNALERAHVIAGEKRRLGKELLAELPTHRQYLKSLFGESP